MPKSSPLKNIPKKRLSKKVAAKTGVKPGAARRLMRSINEVIAELSADRTKFFGGFIETWRVAVANVDLLADAIMAHPSLVVPKEATELMLSPYKLTTFLIYGSLAETLNYAEELELVETANALDRAWGKLLAVLPVRPNVDADDVARLRAALEGLTPRVVGIYQGTEKPEPDAGWIAAFDTASKALAKTTEGLAS